MWYQDFHDFTMISSRDSVKSKSRTLHYFFYKVFRGVGDRSTNTLLFEAGLFTSTHSFTVSIGHFVEPEEEILWKMGDSLPLVPTHLCWALGTVYERERQSRGVTRKGGKRAFISTAIYPCKAPAKSSGLSPHYISWNNTPCNYLIFWLSLTISIWTCQAEFCPGTYHKIVTVN